MSLTGCVCPHIVIVRTIDAVPHDNNMWHVLFRMIQEPVFTDPLNLPADMVLKWKAVLWAPTFKACICAFEFQRGKEEVGMVAFIYLPSVSVCFLVPRSVLGLCLNETLNFVAEMSINQDQRVSVLALSLSNCQVPYICWDAY